VKLYQFGLLALCLSVLAAPLSASSVVLPAQCDNVVNGVGTIVNVATTNCLGSTPANLASSLESIVQQIFDASIFEAAGITGEIKITSLGLRPATNNQVTSATINLTVEATTTSFDANTGCTFTNGVDEDGVGCWNTLQTLTNPTTVYSSNYNFTSTNTGNPLPFQAVNLSTPILYNPETDGNLLLQTSIPANGVTNVTPSGDILNLQALGAYRLPGEGGVLDVVGETEAQISGLVTAFTYTVVPTAPEPGTFTLLGTVGVLALAFFLVRKRPARGSDEAA